MPGRTIRVLHVFGCMNRGGAEMRTLEVMPAMREMGVHFDFCTLSGGTGKLDDEIKRLGGQVIPCPLTWNRIAFERRLIKLLRASNYDIVHGHIHLTSAQALRAAHRAGVPGRVMHFRSVTDIGSNSPIRKAYRAIMHRMANRHANGILAVSRAAMECGWGEQWQQDPRARVIYNGINLERFTDPPAGLRGSLGVPAGAKLVIHVGRFSIEKDHDTTLRAFARLLQQRPNTRLLLAGVGPLQETTQQLAAELGIANHVEFLGVRDDVPQLLRLADCAVLPSLWEGLPGVVLESLAAGTPIVASDIASVREIAAYSGLVSAVPVKSPEKLADGIMSVLDRPLPAQPEPFPDVFDLRRCIEQWHLVYDRLLAGEGDLRA